MLRSRRRMSMVLFLTLLGWMGVQERVWAGKVFAIDISHWTMELTESDVGCWYDNSVRHVIVRATNSLEYGPDPYFYMGGGREIAIQQLQTLKDAKANGIDVSIDIYLWVHWTWGMSVPDQVREAIDLVTVDYSFPVIRLWLDLEENPGRRTQAQIKQILDDSLAVCTEKDFACGIYTNQNFWQYKFGDPPKWWFRKLPLWFANYDSNPDLGTWKDQKFGGWPHPVGKQYADRPHVCRKSVDHNTMYEPYDSIPGKPGGLTPNNGREFPEAAPVRLRSNWIPYVETYQFHVQYKDPNGTWMNYPVAPFNAYGKKSRDGLNFIDFTPTYPGTGYRWRIRARNFKGWSVWTTWATFNNQGGSLTPPAPTGLSPDGGVTISTSSVTLSCNPIADATQYEFEIWKSSGGTWQYYYTYSSSLNSKTLWPSIHGIDYRWQVRAQNAHGWGPFSAWATFHVN